MTAAGFETSPLMSTDPGAAGGVASGERQLLCGASHGDVEHGGDVARLGLVVRDGEPRDGERDAVLLDREDRLVVAEVGIQLAVADHSPGAVEARRLDPVVELVV